MHVFRRDIVYTFCILQKQYNNCSTCSCDIAMGDLQSEEERDIVLEIKLPAVASPGQYTVLKTTLSYFNVITSEFDTVQSDLILSRGGETILSGLSVS